jgi:predicted lipoprotein with Yx(FWY)xxD motif
LEVLINRKRSIRYGAVVVAVLVLGAIAAIAVASSSGSNGHTKVVGTARNKTLHKTVLVNRSGRTLYALSVERHGRFICTNMACLSFWTPLTVPKGVKPGGVSGLGTVKRPDVKGNGFKDVGIWHAVAVSKSRKAAVVSTPRSYGY